MGWLKPWHYRWNPNIQRAEIPFSVTNPLFSKKLEYSIFICLSTVYLLLVQYIYQYHMCLKNFHLTSTNVNY